MVELSRLAISKDTPNKLLAACLYRMISALPEIAVEQEIIQRISLFLSLGVKFHRNNYERFSFSVYAMVAVKNSQCEVVSDLLDRGADLYRMDKDGKTALNYVEKLKRYDVALKLCKYYSKAQHHFRGAMDDPRFLQIST